MPTVNGKKFPYTMKGKLAAKKYAKKTGKEEKSESMAERMREMKTGEE